MDSVFLTDPVVAIGLLLSLAMSIFSVFKKNHIAITAASVTVFVVTVANALLHGADLYETGAAAALFFSIYLIPLLKEGGEK